MLLLFAFGLFAIRIETRCAITQNVITVPDDFPTIQEAVDAAGPGDTVFVKNGVYYEHVTVNKAISLVGEDRNLTVIDGDGSGSVVLFLNVSNARISEFTIRRGGIGVDLEGTLNITISDNIISDSYCGVGFLCDEREELITSNIIANNTYGLATYWIESHAINCTITDNIVSQNREGLVMVHGDEENAWANNLMKDNSIMDNLDCGIFFPAWRNSGLWGNTIVGNEFKRNGGQAIYFYGSGDHNVISENNMTNNWRGVDLEGYYCQSNVISRNNISANDGGGIHVGGASNNCVSENTIVGNGYGVLLDYWLYYDSPDPSSSNVFSDNEFIANREFGVKLHGSANNLFSRNNITDSIDGVSMSDADVWEGDPWGYVPTVGNVFFANRVASNNRYGVGSLNCSGNLFYRNSFIDNAEQASCEVSTNSWDNGYPAGGNYWSNYTGSDLYSGPDQNLVGSDGIGDAPHVINDINQDRYPLMNPSLAPQLIASYTFTPSSPRAGETVSFNASTSAPNDAIVEYRWDFGDGNITATPSKIITHVYPAMGSYNVSLTVTDSEGSTDSVWQEITILSVLRDIAVINVTVQFGEAYQGWINPITITVANRGKTAENFTISLYYGSTLIATLYFENFEPATTMLLTFDWNTTTIPYDIRSFTIKAVASTVLYETNTEDNTFIDGSVRIRMLGDFDGDGNVDMRDIGEVALAFGSHAGGELWNAYADMNQDGRVDMRDIGTPCVNFGKNYL
jgi:parallel beta-helix repeat protein